MGRLSRIARIAPLAAATLATAACVYAPVVPTAWAPSGDEVAFIAAKGGDVYSLKDGRARRLPSRREFTGLSWSPSGDRLAAFSDGSVYTFVRNGEVYRASDTFKLYDGARSGGSHAVVMTWEPSGRRLFVADLDSDRTFQVRLDARDADLLGPGVGVLEADGRTVLWVADVAIGLRSWTMAERQDLYASARSPAAVRALSPETTRVLRQERPLAYRTLSDWSALTLCAQRAAAGRRTLECADQDGGLRTVFSLEASSRASVDVAPDPARSAFLVRDYDADSVRLVDGAGKELASADTLARAVHGLPVPAGAAPARFAGRADQAVSWSSDGKRLAIPLRGGGIVVWDWRDDDVRIVAAPK